ncbi:endopeptidase [Arthrobacter sp. RT-1]|nr:endopeptidase [Arthrobacter sp. RT-1]
MTELTNGHTAVSNEDEDERRTEVGEPVSEPPEEGSASGTPAMTADGAETVDGVARRAELASVDIEWNVPDTSNLHDIGEASFGTPPPLAETVHGPDDRVQITTTSVYPWRVHASLLITAADNSMWIGTGWFNGPHTLITAGHVVYIKNSGVPGRDGWVKSITVMPGRNGSTLPYGTVISRSFRSVSGWINNGDENYDYGAILLNSELGNTVGWFGFGVYSDSDLQSSTANISGYPGDKPSGTQWYASRRIASVNSRKVFYDVDTAGGQSGSAVYRIINGQRYAVAIHAYGGAITNSGTRIVSPVYNNLLNWKK